MNKSYTNPKLGDVPALSRIFNITSPQCGSSFSKPPQITNNIYKQFKVYIQNQSILFRLSLQPLNITKKVNIFTKGCEAIVSSLL